MKDVQNEKDNRNVHIKKVGINKLKFPITIIDKNEGKQHSIGEASLSSELENNIRGTHMSRFIEAIKDLDILSLDNIENMLDKLNKSLNSKKSYFKIEFDYFIKKSSPVTKIVSTNNVKCSLEGTKDEIFTFNMEVTVPVTTLCPCSKEISSYGAHNQRAYITIKLNSNKFIFIEDIVEIAENCSSSPIYSILKRQDEKYVTEYAYNNPRFVEDIVREVSLRLEKNMDIKWYSVYVESIESIHNHNAFAYTEKGCTL